MTRLLETLDLDTSVYCGADLVGTVRGLYAEGSARSVEWVVVDWHGRGPLAVPATEIESIDDRGISLMQSDVHAYDTLIDFSEARFPTAHKLA
jgi:hypothetical protein